MMHFCWNMTALVNEGMTWTNDNSFTLSPTLEIHLIHCDFLPFMPQLKGEVRVQTAVFRSVCVIFSATHVPVEIVVVYVYYTSVVRRSICAFQWGLRMSEIQLDLRGEPVTRSSWESKWSLVLWWRNVFIDLMVSLLVKATSRCS